MIGDQDQHPGEARSDAGLHAPPLAEGELLRQVLETLSPCLDEDEVLTRLQQVVAAWVPHDAGLIARYQNGGVPHLQVTNRHGLSKAVVADQLPAQELLDPWDVTVPVRIDDVEAASERVADAFTRQHLRSLLVVPLGDSAHPQVVIILAAQQPGAFAGVPAAAIERFQQLVAAPLHNAAQFGQAQRAREETLRLAESLYQQVNSGTGDELMQKLLRLARELTHADAGSLMVVLPDSAGLYVRAAHGIPAQIPVESQLPWGDHALDALTAMSAPLRLDNLEANPVEPFGTFAAANGFGSYLGVPVRRGGQLAGLLNLYRRGPHAPWMEDGRVALVAQAIGQALEQDRLRSADQLQREVRAQFHQHKDDLFELLAHQLRTPLTSIKGFAQLLLRRAQHADNDNAAKYLETVLHEANRLSVLVTNVLEISQLEQALIDTRPHALDLSAVLARFRTSPDVTRLAGDRLLHWVLPTEPVLVQGDAPGLTAGLCALLRRVDAAAPADHSITVTLTVLPARSNKGQYPVTLTVQGGESPEGVPALADLLRQLDLRTINSTAAAQWSDLALYMAVQLLQAQGAELSLYTTAEGTLAYEVRFVSPAAH
jgi:GAF domain-containing protein